MDPQKQKQFVLQLLYYGSILALLYVLFYYVIPLFLPFLIGFAIAYILRPIVFRFTQGNHIRLYSTALLFLFYCFLALLLFIAALKGILLLQDLMEQLPAFYQQYIAPYLAQSDLQVSNLSKELPFADILHSLLIQLQQSLASFLSKLTSSFLYTISKLMLSLPNILFAMVSFHRFFLFYQCRLSRHYHRNYKQAAKSVASKAAAYLKTCKNNLETNGKGLWYIAAMYLSSALAGTCLIKSS